MQDKTALFVGRFQPLHKGHMHALEEAFRKYRRVVIVIGSINKNDGKNPFSFGTRKKMLELALRKYKGRFSIIGIPDQESNEKWTKLVTGKADFDVVVTGNPVVKECLKGFETVEPEFYKRELYNATRVREAIRKDEEWEKLVPEEIVGLVLHAQPKTL
jgi:nicotinamide-nucleotide adenylyltransferase